MSLNKGLLHRRHIRIKVLQCFYAFEIEENSSSKESLRFLLQSFDDVYKLYLLMLQSFGEFKTAAQNRKNIILDKRFKQEGAELLYNKFLANPVINAISNNVYLNSEAEKHNILWNQDDSEMFARIFREMSESEMFLRNEAAEPTMAAQLQFACNIFREFVVNATPIQETLEEKNIFWMDDLDLVAINVLKTLESFVESGLEQNHLFRLYKDKDDDIAFGQTLLKNAINNQQEVSTLVEELAKNWEWKRIAKMDRILLRLCIAEAISFPQIPLKVSMNEYVDLAKEYSTEDSATFVNGILDKALKQLQADGKIVKQGRGLKQ